MSASQYTHLTTHELSIFLHLSACCCILILLSTSTKDDCDYNLHTSQPHNDENNEHTIIIELSIINISTHNMNCYDSPHLYHLALVLVVVQIEFVENIQQIDQV